MAEQEKITKNEREKLGRESAGDKKKNQTLIKSSSLSFINMDALTSRGAAEWKNRPHSSFIHSSIIIHSSIKCVSRWSDFNAF